MSNKCHNIALETRARTRENLKGPAHGGPRTPVPPRACVAFPRAARNARPAPRCGRRVKSDPEKAEAKTAQGSAGAAGGLRRSGWRRRRKRRRPTARFSVPLWRSPPRRWSRCPRASPSSDGLSGVPGLMRAQRAASALNPLCAEGEGLRGR